MLKEIEKHQKEHFLPYRQKNISIETKIEAINMENEEKVKEIARYLNLHKDIIGTIKRNLEN